MKVTKVKYVSEGDKIQVVEILNCSTPTEVEDEFGRFIRKVYFGQYPNYYGRRNRIHDTDGPIVSIRIGAKSHRPLRLEVGGTYPKDEFQLYIATMKAGAERLIGLRSSMKDMQVKTIKI